MGPPVCAQHLEGRLRQGDVQVFLAFSVDMQEHAPTVHIWDLKMCSLEQPQPTGVGRSQTSVIDRDADFSQNAAYLVAAQDNRQLFLTRRTEKLQRGPVLPESLLVEKLDSAQCNRSRGAGDLLLVGQVEKVLAKVLLGEQVRAPVIMFGELANGSNVALLSSCGEPPQLHILHHPLT